MSATVPSSGLERSDRKSWPGRLRLAGSAALEALRRRHARLGDLHRDAKEERGAWTPVVLGFLAFLLAAGLAGPLSPALTRALLALALGAVVVPVVRRARGAALWARAALLFVPVWPLVAAHVTHGDATAIDLLAVVAGLAGAAWLGRATALGRTLALGADAVALAALVVVGMRQLPVVWSGLDAVALAISRSAGSLSGTPVELGPTFAGVWVVVLYAALGAVFVAAGGRRTLTPALRAGALLVVTLALVVAYAAVMPWIEAGLRAAAQALVMPPADHVFDPDQPRQLRPGTLASIGNVLLVLAMWLPARFLLRPAPAAPAGGRGRPLVAALAVLAIVVGAGGLGTRSALVAPAGATIAFYDDGMLDFSSPERGRYGLNQVGMFGSASRFLELAGYQVAKVARADLPDALKTVDVLVVINLRQSFDDREREAIWSFVRKGGGLLVLGDHTDLFGMMKPLNRLLEPIGTRFIFDSAFPLRSHWQDAIEVRPHPITSGVVDARDLEIGTGGSLVLDDLRARPVVVGRYAFSDLGNRLNDGQGGMLGDYRYQVGERLGDVVLVASAEVGDGRVVVFGDTSTIQILSVPQARAFVDRVFAYVAGGSERRPAALGIALWVLLGVGVVGLIWTRRPGALVVPLALALLAAAAVRDLRPPPAPTPLRPPEAVALVDTGHVPYAPYEFFVEGSIGGLFAALYRAGYLPVTGGLNNEDLDQVGMVVLFAPSAPYSAADRDRLARFLERGGTLLIVADGRHPELVAGPLGLCGMAIDPLPLGPATAPWHGKELEMVDAWPIRAIGDQALTIHAAWKGYGLVAETRPGRGRCLAVGDPRFFHDQNFEGERQFQPVNVAFVDALLARTSTP